MQESGLFKTCTQLTHQSTSNSIFKMKRYNYTVLFPMVESHPSRKNWPSNDKQFHKICLAKRSWWGMKPDRERATTSESCAWWILYRLIMLLGRAKICLEPTVLQYSEISQINCPKCQDRVQILTELRIRDFIHDPHQTWASLHHWKLIFEILDWWSSQDFTEEFSDIYGHFINILNQKQQQDRNKDWQKTHRCSKLTHSRKNVAAISKIVSSQKQPSSSPDWARH